MHIKIHVQKYYLVHAEWYITKGLTYEECRSILEDLHSILDQWQILDFIWTFEEVTFLFSSELQFNSVKKKTIGFKQHIEMHKKEVGAMRDKHWTTIMLLDSAYIVLWLI